MTSTEIKAAIEDAKFDYDYIGIRFETRTVAIGTVLDNSRNNPDRNDERDFPAYGTPEYDAMDELDGTCAYSANSPTVLDLLANGHDQYPSDTHCYLIAAKRLGANDYPDEGEIVLVDPTVIAELF